MTEREKVLAEAAKWVGYLEKASDSQLEHMTANAGSKNYTIFAKWYRDQWKQNYQAQPWCAVWVSVVFLRALGADRQAKAMKHFAYCPTGVNQFKTADGWKRAAPVPGDVIFFRDAKGVASHVGLVERTDSTRVYTIEGNTSAGPGVIPNGGAVVRKSYYLTYNRILGFGMPDYLEGDDDDVKRYDKVADMPAYAKPTIEKLIKKGILKGGASGLDLSEDMLRMMVYDDRAMLYALPEILAALGVTVDAKTGKVTVKHD